MVELLRTTDPIKLGAVQALLAAAGVAAATFDGAAGSLWRAIIPLRLMVSEADADTARAILRGAGFREAADGDWDLVRPAPWAHRAEADEPDGSR